MKRIIVSFGKVLVSGILAMAICSLFCVGYKYSRLSVNAPMGATEVTSVPNSFQSNMEEGLAWRWMDANGYNNVTTYKDTDVLIMGGSHIEGLQISQRDNLSYKLQEYLQNMKVYNVGKSSHYLDMCVNNLNDACKSFNPSYVVIDANPLLCSKENMEAILNGTYEKVKPAADSSWYRYVEDYIPMTKLLLLNLQKWIENASIAESSAIINMDNVGYKNVLDSFLLYAEDIAYKQGCKLIFLYHPDNYSIAKDGSLQYEDDSKQLNILQTVCDKHNITLVNTKEENIKMYREQHVLPNGFVNTSFGKGHLNKYGHEAAARVLAGTITEMEEED